MEEHSRRLVICTGQAGGRGAISLERVAINVNDARIPDNIGARPIDLPIVADGPAAYFTSLPIKAMLQRLLDAGVRAEASQTAGTFVCNQTFYGLMHLLAPRWQGVRGGLIHVPWLPQQGSPRCGWTRSCAAWRPRSPAPCRRATTSARKPGP